MKSPGRENRWRRVGLALIVIAPVWFGVRAWNQNERNYALSEAVGHQDVARVRRLLEAGANPNAPWSGYSWRDYLDRMLRRGPWADGDLTILQWAGAPERNDEINRLLRQYAGTR